MTTATPKPSRWKTYMPTAAQIAAACLEIQAGWTARERESRIVIHNGKVGIRVHSSAEGFDHIGELVSRDPKPRKRFRSKKPTQQGKQP